MYNFSLQTVQGMLHFMTEHGVDADLQWLGHLDCLRNASDLGPRSRAPSALGAGVAGQRRLPVRAAQALFEAHGLGFDTSFLDAQETTALARASNGTFEAENIQRAYKDCLLPKLGPHQFAVLNPYIAANDPANCAKYNNTFKDDCDLGIQATVEEGDAVIAIDSQLSSIEIPHVEQRGLRRIWQHRFCAIPGGRERQAARRLLRLRQDRA